MIEPPIGLTLRVHCRGFFRHKRWQGNLTPNPRSGVLVYIQSGGFFHRVGVKCMTATTGTPGKGSAPVRRGSNFSDRQIAHAVKGRRAIRAALPSVSGWEHITGWVYGGDDYHWGIVTAQEELFLVHKTVPAIQILDLRIDDLEDEGQQETVGSLVEPFRQRVMRDHFGQQPNSSS